MTAVAAVPRSFGVGNASDPSKPTAGAEVPFREIVPGPDHPKIAGISTSDPIKWCQSRRDISALTWLINRLEAKNLEKPYVGITNDGVVREGVYKYAEDEGAPVEEMVGAANKVLSVLDEQQKERVVHKSVEADEIRLWSNPELYINPGGIRLEECSGQVQEAVHNLLRASFSLAGYAKVHGCCLTNDFLGHLVNGKNILNEHSYNFRLFGEPHLKKPWGYTFFGHHLCLAVVVYGKRMAIGPTFMGAEPDRIDEGPHTGLRLFEFQELGALKLMQSLPTELQERATLTLGMDGDSLPPERWNPFDERHLGGARQDNRVIPFEGCPVELFNQWQQSQIFELYKAFNSYYPDSVLEHRLNVFKANLHETYFAWIGPHGEHDAFYYRIHSPVALMEFDFHCGIFLTNTSPARCHIHTLNRLPNGGDYGKAMIAQGLTNGHM